MTYALHLLQTLLPLPPPTVSIVTSRDDCFAIGDDVNKSSVWFYSTYSPHKPTKGFVFQTRLIEREYRPRGLHYVKLKVVVVAMCAESHLAVVVARSLPGDIGIFRNSIWRPPPSWIFMISEFGTLRRDQFKSSQLFD